MHVTIDRACSVYKELLFPTGVNVSQPLLTLLASCC